MSLQSKVDEILARLGDIDTASSTIDVETVELVVSFIKNDLLPWLDDFAYKGRHANAAFFMKELMKKLETVLLVSGPKSTSTAKLSQCQGSDS